LRTSLDTRGKILNLGTRKNKLNCIPKNFIMNIEFVSPDNQPVFRILHQTCTSYPIKQGAGLSHISTVLVLRRIVLLYRFSSQFFHTCVIIILLYLQIANVFLPIPILLTNQSTFLTTALNLQTLHNQRVDIVI
jgi:hypothetical protein